MQELITLCGDNCLSCPRYKEQDAEQLEYVAKLWYRVGWRDTILSADEIKCNGCSSHKQCAYHLVECTKVHKVEKCNQCNSFPCGIISDMMQKSDEYQKRAKEVCSEEEYIKLEAAFFNKSENLRK